MQEFQGIVQKGRRRGHELGFPTINIPLQDARVSGIYAARVRSAVRTKVHTFHAAAFADPSRDILEAHLLDFSGDLYGQEVRIELCQKLRESERYQDDEALRAAIASDVAAVRQYFAS
jgi:riboflavin kinase/FMN adenylyltransferase